MTVKVVLGVLALQGAFHEHIEFFRRIAEGPQYTNYAFEFLQVRTPQDLALCDSLVIPGGESTAISLIAESTHLFEPLLGFVRNSEKSVWGTCAGLIFLAQQLKNGKPEQKILGGLNIEVTRNAFGRQLDSFTQALDFSSFIPDLSDFPAVFIRAPVVTRINCNEAVTDSSVITSPLSPSHDPVQVLHKLERKGNDLIVAVRQGNILGTSFHPELSDDLRFHKWFLDEFVLRAVDKK